MAATITANRAANSANNRNSADRANPYKNDILGGTGRSVLGFRDDE